MNGEVLYTTAGRSGDHGFGGGQSSVSNTLCKTYKKQCLEQLYAHLNDLVISGKLNEEMGFERRKNPLDSIGIGITQKRRFKTVDEAARYFLANIERTSEGRFKDIEEFKDECIKVSYTEKSHLSMSKDYLEGFKDPINREQSKYPSIYIEEWGTILIM